MTKTGTQNRPYPPEVLLVKATFECQSKTHMVFDWNDRQAVRGFAAVADEVIRKGGTVTTRRQV